MTTHARSTDPTSSKMSGTDIEKSPSAATLQGLLLKQFGKKSMTAEMACEAAGLNPWNGGWKRVSDLKNKGLVEPRKDKKGAILRWVNRSGKRADVLIITSKGREALKAFKAKA